MTQNEWLPIETYRALKKHQAAVFYFPQYKSGRMDLSPTIQMQPTYGVRSPTHWMLLPPPPESK